MPIAESLIGLLLILLCIFSLRWCCDYSAARQRDALRDHDEDPPSWQVRLHSGFSSGHYARLPS